MQIGIIPTEGFPALVCDLCNTQAVLRLAAMKDVSPKKPMSILVRNFTDVDKYTLGWPRLTTPGEVFVQCHCCRGLLCRSCTNVETVVCAALH